MREPNSPVQSVMLTSLVGRTEVPDTDVRSGVFLESPQERRCQSSCPRVRAHGYGNKCYSPALWLRCPLSVPFREGDVSWSRSPSVENQIAWSAVSCESFLYFITIISWAIITTLICINPPSFYIGTYYRYHMFCVIFGHLISPIRYKQLLYFKQYGIGFLLFLKGQFFYISKQFCCRKQRTSSL